MYTRISGGVLRKLLGIVNTRISSGVLRKLLGIINTRISGGVYCIEKTISIVNERF